MNSLSNELASFLAANETVDEQFEAAVAGLKQRFPAFSWASIQNELTLLENSLQLVWAAGTPSPATWPPFKSRRLM